MTWFRRPAGDEPGRTSLGYNALDRHVVAGRATKTALVVPNGSDRDFAGLLEEASALGGAFDDLGVVAGSSVLVALADPVDELVAVLACARLGAVAHVTDPASVATASDLAEPVLVATSAAPEFGAHVPASCLLRDSDPIDPTRDLDWEVALRAGRTRGSAVAERGPEDPAYVVDGRTVTVLAAMTATDRVGTRLADLVAGRAVRLTATESEDESA